DRRERGSAGTDCFRYNHIVGGYDDRTRLHLEECRHHEYERNLYKARLARCNQSWPVYQRYLRRSGGFEPRLDLVLELQLANSDDAGPRVLSNLQPGSRYSDVDKPRRIGSGSIPRLSGDWRRL